MPKTGRQTPTYKSIIPYKKSKYKEAVEMYNQSGSKMLKWQENLLKDIMAVNSEGLWTHTKFGYSVSRRNGKTESIIARLGYSAMIGEQVLYTAQLSDTARSTWERVCYMLDQNKIEYKPYRSAGREEVFIEATGCRMKFRTRTGRSGLGTGVDLLILDECQEYTQEQESALKYIVSSSANPQTLMCGTPPTIVSAGTVFKKYRENIQAGKLQDSGWAEWSVPTMTDVWDKNSWYETNPSLGYVTENGIPLLTERDITGEIGSDDEDFNIQRLGLWIARNLKSSISEGLWNNLAVDFGDVKSFSVGIDFGKDSVNAYMSIAGKTSDGRIYVEAIDKKPISEGDWWILDFINRNKQHINNVIVDGASRQQILADEMKDWRLKAPVLPKVSEVILAYALFENNIYSSTICHNNQKAMDHIIANCGKRPIGKNGGWAYTALIDGDEIGILSSAVFAHYGATIAKERRPQRIRC